MIFSLYFLEHKYSYIVVRYSFILNNYNMNLSVMYKKIFCTSIVEDSLLARYKFFPIQSNAMA